MGLNERIKLARGNRTQSEFADAIDVSRGAVSQWERKNDPISPKQAHLDKIASLTGVSLAWLILGIGPVHENGQQDPTTASDGSQIEQQLVHQSKRYDSEVFKEAYEEMLIAEKNIFGDGMLPSDRIDLVEKIYSAKLKKKKEEE